MDVINIIKCVMNQPVPFGYICIYVILSIMVVACVLCKCIDELDDEVEKLKQEQRDDMDRVRKWLNIQLNINANLRESIDSLEDKAETKP